MDKIEISKWGDYFSRTEHTVLHASERYAETLFRFEEPDLASGNIMTVSTPGMVLTQLSVAPAKPFALTDKESKEGAESVFILEGNVESRFPTIKTPLHFERHRHSIQYNTDFTGEHIFHSGRFQAISINYDLAYLNNLLQSAGAGPLEQIGKNIERKQNFLARPYSLSFQARIGEVVHAIQQCVFQGITRYIFMESKMMELFVLQMEHLRTVQTAPSKEKWSSTDREKLFGVKEYIEGTYLEPVTLKELTCRFALNEFKLKKGYKHFFQTTVFGHIHHLRMQRAKKLLMDKQMNVSEAAWFIGYNNIGSFSAEFKKRFGYTPSQLK
jgi:AraC-like DNA-binding protein